MAAASRRRHMPQSTKPTKKSTKSTKSTNSKKPRKSKNRQSLHQRTHRLHPDDPRLKLSMRAFHPVLDKSRARRPRLSFSSSQSSQSSTIAPSTTYLAFPSSTRTYAELYDPSSPWGVKGIKYDPCSPWANNTMVSRPFLLAASSNTDSAAPHSSPSPPPPGRPELQFYLEASTDLQRTQDAANHGLASDIADMLATRRQTGETREKERPQAKDKDKNKKKPNYPNMRFVLADTTTTTTPESAATAKALLSKVFMGASTSRPTKTTPKKAQPAKKTPVPVPASSCSCPPQVPSIVHILIDNKTSDPSETKSKLNMLKQQFGGALLLLCPSHREKYQRIEAAPIAGFSVFSVRPSANAPALQYTPSRPPPALPKPAAALHWTPTTATTPIAPTASRPLSKPARDDMYRHDMLREIAGGFPALKSEEEYTHGEVTNRVVYDLLHVAVHPQPVVNGQGDAHFLSGEEAYELLDRCSPHEPVVTQNEQMFRWRPRTRPIEELFRRMENLDRKVSVQVPSRRCTDDSFESRDLVEVRRRFLQPSRANDDPWNILDLRSPLPAAVLPQFLTSENCQLLPRLRDEVLNPSRAERDSASREQWNEWRDVLEWVLLSEGGHNTSPHTDSHGLATWITVQEGLFGFGWMSHPTAAERQQWMDDPQGFKGGRWCFMILEPGQTVFFNSGTVHFVFRQHGQATLALGGHILQWSGIERWLEIVSAQMKNPHITNEDMEWSAPKYVRVVARLVAMRLQQEQQEQQEQQGHNDHKANRIEAMGGEVAVKHLLGQLKDFDDEYIRPRSKSRYKKKKR